MPQSSLLPTPGRYMLMALGLIVAIIAADQYSKWRMMEDVLRMEGVPLPFGEWLTTRQPVSFFLDQRETFRAVTVTSFFNLVVVWNQGISFGLFNNPGTETSMPLVLIGLSLVISLGMLIWLMVARSRVQALALAFIVGGALGNVIDRLRFGAVFDFLDFHVSGHHWPAFNVADSFVVIGGILLAVYIAFLEKSETE